MINSITTNVCSVYGVDENTIYNELHAFRSAKTDESIKKFYLLIDKYPKMIGKNSPSDFDKDRLFEDIKILSYMDEPRIFKKIFDEGNELVKNLMIESMIKQMLDDSSPWSFFSRYVKFLTPILPPNLSDIFDFQRERITSPGILSLIEIFPKVDWLEILWNPCSRRSANSDKSLTTEYFSDKQLFMYSMLRGKERFEDLEQELCQKFLGFHILFKCSKIFDDLKEIVILKTLSLEYPILLNGDCDKETISKYMNYSKQIDKEYNTKITRLSFRKFRENNGLWDKKYSRSMKIHITDMFLECLSQYDVLNYDKRTKFIEEVGKNRNCKKPVLNVDDIRSILRTLHKTDREQEEKALQNQ